MEDSKDLSKPPLIEWFYSETVEAWVSTNELVNETGYQAFRDDTGDWKAVVVNEYCEAELELGSFETADTAKAFCQLHVFELFEDSLKLSEVA